MYTCSQVAKWIASDEYSTAGLLKRLGIRLHLAMCRNCSTYQRQLKALGSTLRAIYRELPLSVEGPATNRIVDKLIRKS